MRMEITIDQNNSGEQKWIPGLRIVEHEEYVYVVDFMTNWKMYFFPFMIWHMSNLTALKIPKVEWNRNCDRIKKANTQYLTIGSIIYYITLFILLRIIMTLGYSESANGMENTYWILPFLFVGGMFATCVVNKAFLKYQSYLWGLNDMNHTKVKVSFKAKSIMLNTVNPILATLLLIALNVGMEYLYASSDMGTDALVTILSGFAVAGVCFVSKIAPGCIQMKVSDMNYK